MSVLDFLRDAGIQPSQQRIKIYEKLSAVKTHPSADTIYHWLSPEMPTLSRTTVFSTLDLFFKKGIAQKLALSGSELRYDADTSRHVHFHCRRCGAVLDLPDCPAPPPPASQSGFVVESSQYYAEGLCPECSAKGAS